VHVSQTNDYAGRVICDKNSPAFRKQTVMINNIFNGVSTIDNNRLTYISIFFIEQL